MSAIDYDHDRANANAIYRRNLEFEAYRDALPASGRFTLEQARHALPVVPGMSNAQVMDVLVANGYVRTVDGGFECVPPAKPYVPPAETSSYVDPQVAWTRVVVREEIDKRLKELGLI